MTKNKGLLLPNTERVIDIKNSELKKKTIIDQVLRSISKNANFAPFY